MRGVALALITAGVFACTPVLPAPNTAPLGDDSSDGVVVPLSLEAGPARDAVNRAFRVNGFTVAAASSHALRSDPRRVSVDTTLVLIAMIVPVELPNARSYVTVSGNYSVGGSGDVSRVTRGAATVRGPWRYLTAIADSLRQIAARAP